jgi:hypothetical protein
VTPPCGDDDENDDDDAGMAMAVARGTRTTKDGRGGFPFPKHEGMSVCLSNYSLIN